MADVGMPRMSDSMTEGSIGRWLVEDLSFVNRGQEIIEIETDKALMTYEAEHEGIIHILVGEGETVDVGYVIATIIPENRASGF